MKVWIILWKLQGQEKSGVREYVVQVNTRNLYKRPYSLARLEGLQPGKVTNMTALVRQ